MQSEKGRIGEMRPLCFFRSAAYDETMRQVPSFMRQATPVSS